MGKVLTAQDLDAEATLEDSQKDPDKDSSIALKGGPEDEGTIGEEEKKEEGEKTEPKPPKYKSIEEAEKAVEEAKKKMHEATTKAARLEKILADLEKKAELGTIPKGEEGKSVWDIEKARIIKNTISKIQSMTIPQEGEDNYATKMTEYNNKVAEIWIDSQAEIAKITVAQQKQADEDAAIVNAEIAKKLKKAGLSEIEGIEEIFWSQAQKVSRELTVEEQIDWTIDKCKEFIEGIRSKERSRAETEEKERERLRVLGRGGKFRASGETEPIGKTMSDAHRRVLEKRRLGK